MAWDIVKGDVDICPTLGHYYQDYSGTLTSETLAFYYGDDFDANGVPRINYTTLFRGHPQVDQTRNYGIHYTPVTIAQYALALWSAYLQTGRDEHARAFLAQSDWLCRNRTFTAAGFSLWLHEFEFPIYRLTPPWASAMAQGQGISVLVRAYQLTGESSYREEAQRAFGAFQATIQECGVAIVEEDNGLWLEEYPSEPPSHVLNGFIFALWGAFDLFRVTQYMPAYDVWMRGTSTLKRNLSRYERAWWSCYDLAHRELAARDYHRLHVLQLQVLGELTGESDFTTMADRWESYLAGQARVRRLAIRKLRGLLRRTRLLTVTDIRGVGAHCANQPARR